MKRYSQDYGSGLYYDHRTARWLPTKRQPLTRAQAARVIAAPLPKRAHGHGKAIVVALAIGAAWALAFVIAFAS